MKDARETLQTPDDVFRWTESFTNLERTSLSPEQRLYRLDRMNTLLDRFGDPHRVPRIIHVAGTKGKGSTSALIASALHAAGHRTGVYTSPHVTSAFERIALAGEEPRPQLLLRVAREVKQFIDALPSEGLPGHFAPTTFELLTLLAFLYFREAGCTEAVIEVGIGGRLDATNVVSPKASVITPLDLEHTDILGDTLAKIAFEKGGIIKPGIPVFISQQPPEAVEVFLRISAERGSLCTFLPDAAQITAVSTGPQGTSFSLTLKDDEERHFTLALLGDFQAENAALAYLALRRTRPDIPLAAFQQGFGSVRLPGRMELWPGDPPILLDGAHTPLAVTRLLESLPRIFRGDAVLIFGSVSGKRPRAMAEILAPRFRHVVVSRPGTFKESDPGAVAAVFKEMNPRTELEPDPVRALSLARRLAGAGVPIVVTGSFYMVAEIRRLL